MNFLDYIAIALWCLPLLAIVAASYFLNSERDQDWAKPEDDKDKPCDP